MDTGDTKRLRTWPGFQDRTSKVDDTGKRAWIQDMETGPGLRAAWGREAQEGGGDQGLHRPFNAEVTQAAFGPGRGRKVSNSGNESRGFSECVLVCMNGLGWLLDSPSTTGSGRLVTHSKRVCLRQASPSTSK